MRRFSYLLVLLIIPTFIFWGCSEDSTSSDKVDEFAVLVEYIESDGGDYVNTAAPAIKSAVDVKTDLTSGKQYLIDVRSAADFALGHVEGAVNVPLSDLITHVEGLTTDYDDIVIICYTGQSAAFGTCLLRLLGHDNVYSMLFGMSSWHSDFDSWTSNCANTHSTQFVTTDFQKGPEVDFPVLNTGEEEAVDILRARVEAVLEAGFGAVGISAATVVANPSNYYIVNYWGEADYTGYGHIDGAKQYTPKQDLHSTTYLNTLPTDQEVVVYCWTGQTSANMAAFLSVLGYNAKTLKFGANTMIYDELTGHKFSAGAIMNYDYVTGN